MGFAEEDASPSSPVSTPKLSLFSLSNQVKEPPGMLTPPLHTPASIPFLWEEAPGKPLVSTYTTTTSGTSTNLARCLELPPRLATQEAKTADMPLTFSPSTVLEGPYLRRTLSAREGFRSFQDIGSLSKRREISDKGSSGYFGGSSWRKKNSKRNTRVCEDSCVISPPSSSSSTVGDTEGHANVKITRIKRTGSFFSLSTSKSHHNHSHLWASIYGTFKQVVPLPWRSRKMKKNGHSL